MDKKKVPMEKNVAYELHNPVFQKPSSGRKNTSQKPTYVNNYEHNNLTRDIIIQYQYCSTTFVTMNCDEMLVQLSNLAQPHTDMAADHKERSHGNNC